MKIKFSILSALLCLFAVSSWADEIKKHVDTEDYVEFSMHEFEPGGASIQVTVSLKGSMKYTAFGMDIYLPNGYEVDYKNNKVRVSLATTSDIYPKDEDTGLPYHTLGAEMQSDGALRVTVSSLSNDLFEEVEGALFKFYVKASPYAKPGDASFSVANCYFVSDQAIQYDAKVKTIIEQTGTTCTLPVSISETNKWSTFVSPIDTTLPGVKVYTCETADDDFAYLSTQTSVKAYVPYVVYAENGYSETLTGTADASKYPEGDYCEKGLLVGAYAPIEATAGKYVLQNHDGVVKFYKIAEEDVFTIPAGKCYLNPGTGTNSAKLAITVEDEADGINEVNANANADAIYDLQGRKVEHPQKNGIYIVNGKTVIKK